MTFSHDKISVDDLFPQHNPKAASQQRGTSKGVLHSKSLHTGALSQPGDAAAATTTSSTIPLAAPVQEPAKAVCSQAAAKPKAGQNWRLNSSGVSGVELRKQCKARGLPQYGAVQVLMDRLRAAGIDPGALQTSSGKEHSVKTW